MEYNRDANGWISVNEPPTEEGAYLVCKELCANTYIDINSFIIVPSKTLSDFCEADRNVWCDYDSEWGYYQVDNVLYWRELPDLPIALKGDK